MTTLTDADLETITEALDDAIQYVGEQRRLPWMTTMEHEAWADWERRYRDLRARLTRTTEEEKEAIDG